LEQISKIVLDNPGIAKKFKYPGLEKDQLFKAEFTYINNEKKYKDYYSSLNINLIKRKIWHNTNIVLYYKIIGSIDQVIKDMILRNK